MISVVMATYNRSHLLARSLHGYANSNLSEPLELVIIDDDSTDNTFHLIQAWSHDLDIKYIRLFKPPGLWRDAACLINLGIRAAKGAVVVATHPEAIPGRTSLQALWDARAKRAYLACKIYYLSVANQDAIDTVDWQADPLAVRQLPNFYAEPSAELRGHDDYSHEGTDRHTTWESWVFGGMTKATWRWFGGFSEYQTWGSADVAFLNRRRVLGVETRTMLDEQTICIHQNHDAARTETDVLTPRDLTVAMAALPPVWTPENARLEHI